MGVATVGGGVVLEADGGDFVGGVGVFGVTGGGGVVGGVVGGFLTCP